jgi:CheY-like chemotaxis protein
MTRSYPVARRCRILLADDDVVLQRSIRRVAEAAGYEVIIAATGREVISVAADSQPDLIVLDIRFPDADGRDLLKVLKLDPATESIPVLMWSASSYDSDRRIALALGAEDYVEKGLPTRLLPKIARILLRLEETGQSESPSQGNVLARDLGSVTGAASRAARETFSGAT